MQRTSTILRLTPASNSGRDDRLFMTRFLKIHAQRHYVKSALAVLFLEHLIKKFRIQIAFLKNPVRVKPPLIIISWILTLCDFTHIQVNLSDGVTPAAEDCT